MKKFICLLLAVSMLITILPSSAFAEDIKLLKKEDFESLSLGTTVIPGLSCKGNVFIKESTDGKNKAAELSGTSGENGFVYSFDANKGTVSLSVDILYKNSWAYTEFFITGSFGKEMLLAYIKENGQLYTGDSHIVSGVPRGRFANIQITYNCKRQKLTVYINGKRYINSRYMGANAFEEAAAMGIKVTSSENVSCMADNFTVFDGSRLYASESASSATEYVSMQGTDTVASSGENSEFISDTVYVNRVFGEEGVPEFDKLSVTPASNKIETEKSIFDSNIYIKLTKTQATESHIGFAGSPTERYHVIECSFSTETNTPSGRLLFVRDGNAESMFETFLSVKTNGDVQTVYGDVVAKIKPLEWTDISLVLDMQNLVFDVYVNKELKAEKVLFKNKTITGLPLIRTGCDNSSSTGTLLIDNIKSYGGKTIREIEAQKYGPITEQNKVPENYLGSKKAVHPFAETIFTDGKKQNCTHKFILEDENSTVWMHKDDLTNLFGENLNFGTAHNSDSNYYNLMTTAKDNGYLHQKMDTRLVVFDKKNVKLTQAQLLSIQRYMYYVRPDAEELVEMFESFNKNEHPRVLINKQKLEEIKKLCKTDPLMKKWSENVIKNATYWFGRDVANYQELLDNADGAITNLSMAFHLTGDDRYVARAWKFLEKICSLADWNPAHYLTTGEFTYITGLGYDWLYNEFEPWQREYLEKNILEKGVGYTHKLYFNQLVADVDGYIGWWQAESNWNAVCNGGTMCGAIAIFDKYPQICSELIENASKGLEGMLTLYYPSGTYEEGLSYWTYAMTYLTHTIQSFRNAFGTDFGIADVPGFDKTGWYIINLTGSTSVMTMGDVDSKLLNNPHIMFTATNFGDRELMAARLNEMEKLGYEGGVFDMIYYDATLASGNVNLSLDSYMEGAEVISLRERWYDKGAVYLGASGGGNHRAHGHMDIGSFVVDMSGERFIIDIGAENYSAKGGYFTANRYYFYRARPEGHNLYLINPEDTLEYYGMDKNASATGELLVSKPRGGIGVMDLSQAYAGYATSAKRGYMLSDDRRSVTVRDEIELAKPDSKVYWFLHTKADIESINGTSAVLKQNGKKMLITIETNGQDAVLEETEPSSLGTATKAVVADSDNAKAGVRKLSLSLRASGRLNISAKFKAFDDDATPSQPCEGDISTWTIPDGEAVVLPKLDSICIDGKPLEGFIPTVTGYTQLVSSGRSDVPVVTASAESETEIIQAKEFGEDAIIRVYSKNDKNVYRTYRVTLYKLPPLDDIDGMRRYPVAEVTASEVPQVENGAENVIDNSLDTRWAAEGVNGHWICLELDDIYPIEKLGTSWMSGNARKYKHKIEISTDGIQWTTVFDGASSGTTNEVEYTNTKGAMAKYVRCTAYGNSVNNWNSLTEFVVLGNQR